VFVDGDTAAVIDIGIYKVKFQGESSQQFRERFFDVSESRKGNGGSLPRVQRPARRYKQLVKERAGTRGALFPQCVPLMNF